MYLSSVLDDFSRHIIAWKLCTNIRPQNVTDRQDMALAASGCDQADVHHKPRLLSDNGPSSRPARSVHRQTQGKIERWHQTLNNRTLLENCFLPGDLSRQIEAFVEHYNHRRYQRASITSPRPTPTSAGPRPSSNSAK